MIVLGVDTDARGALALLDTKALTLDVYPTPTLKIKMASGKHQLQANYPVLTAIMIDLISYADVTFLEKQWSRPGQGVTSTFGFGRTYGEYLAAAAAGFIHKGMPVEKIDDLIHLVPGAEWKGKMRLSKDKKEARALASQLFPACAKAWKAKDSTAEASLLAFYGASVMGEKFSFGSGIKPSDIRRTMHADNMAL